eukprot:298308_1
MKRIKRITNHLSLSGNNNLNNEYCRGENQVGLGDKITLIGSGLIGRNWAVLFARAGYTVCMYDISSKQLEIAIKDLKEFRVPLLLKYDMLFGCNKNEILSRISTTTDLNIAVKNAIFIQEGVPESLQLKQKVFKTLSNALYKVNGAHCSTIISSSASTIVPSKLIKKMDYFKSNLIISHPVNPPMAIPVVEICPSPITNKNIILKTKNIMQNIGLKPCTMKKEADGFIVNRLQYALLQAAYQLVSDGVASASDIDMTVKHGLGLRWSFMGPFETIHLNAPNGVNDYCERYTKGMHHVLSLMFKPDKNGNESYEHWTPQIWNKIHNDIENNICKVNELKDRCEWRDSRLLNLAVHKREQDKKDQKM